MTRHFPFSRQSGWRLGRAGRADGRLGVPAEDADRLPPRLDELAAAGSADADLEAERWAALDRKRRAAWADAVRALANAVRGVDETEAAWQAARTEYERCHGAVPETPDPKARRYWLLLAVLAAVEFPLNVAAFSNLGDSIVLSLLAGAGVGIGLLAAAHALGDFLRNTERWNWRRIALAVGLLLSGAAVVVGAGLLRRAFAAAHTTTGGVDPDTVFLCLVTLNALFFVVGTAYGYRAHPAGGGELVRTWKALRRAEHDAGRAARRVEAARSARQADFDASAARIDWLEDTVHLRSARYWSEHARARGALPKGAACTAIVQRPGRYDDGLDWTVPGLNPSALLARAAEKVVGLPTATPDTSATAPETLAPPRGDGASDVFPAAPSSQ